MVVMNIEVFHVARTNFVNTEPTILDKQDINKALAYI